MTTRGKLLLGLGIVTVLAMVFFVVPESAFAQNVLTIDELGLSAVEQTGLNAQRSLPEIIARVIRVALGLLGIAAVVIVLIGGFMWMTAGGDADKVEKAKKTGKGCLKY